MPCSLSYHSQDIFKKWFREWYDKEQGIYHLDVLECIDDVGRLTKKVSQMDWSDLEGDAVQIDLRKVAGKI